MWFCQHGGVDAVHFALGFSNDSDIHQAVLVGVPGTHHHDPLPWHDEEEEHGSDSTGLRWKNLEHFICLGGCSSWEECRGQEFGRLSWSKAHGFCSSLQLEWTKVCSMFEALEQNPVASILKIANSGVLRVTNAKTIRLSRTSTGAGAASGAHAAER